MFILIIVFIILLGIAVNYIMSKLTVNLDPTLSQEIKDGIDKEELENLKKRLSGLDDDDHVETFLSLDQMNLTPGSTNNNMVPRIVSSEALLASSVSGTAQKIRQFKSNIMSSDKKRAKSSLETIGSQGENNPPLVTPDSDLDLLMNIWKKSIKNSEFIAIYNSHKLALSPSTVTMMTHRMCGYINNRSIDKGDLYLAGYLQGALDVSVSQYKQLIDSTISNITNLVAGHASALQTSQQILATSSQNVGVLQQNINMLIGKITTSKKEIEEINKAAKIKTKHLTSTPTLMVPPAPVYTEPPTLSLNCQENPIKIVFSEVKNKIFMNEKTKELVKTRKGLLTALKQANYKGLVGVINYDLMNIIDSRYDRADIPACAFKDED